MPYIGKTPTVGNFQVCDAISVVNGQAAYTLQVGGANVAPESANHMLVSLNGILQKPGSSFTISGSTMTFASNLATGDVIDFVQILGNVLDLGQPSDDTVTAAKLNDNVISGQTALTDAPASTDELLISDGGTLKRIDVSLIGGDNTPAWQVKLSSDVTLGTSNQKVAWNSEDVDTDSAFDSSTNYRFTVPSGEGGKYFISMKVSIEDLDDGQGGQMNLYKNGSEAGLYQANEKATTSGQVLTLESAGIISLNASDYLEVYITQNSGSNQEIYSFNSLFMGYKLIGV